MQSVVNPMCFRVSHRIKYVVFICLMFVTSSTCSNDTSQIKYDVFVSFRGVDVRRGFLSHLIEAFSQKQIAFFVDDNIQKGEELSEALLGAIEESLISLVIFSENYGSSRWCLLELEKILECRRKNGQIVMPIFYEVDPSDVRHQRRTYGDAFVKHERNYSSTTVQSWRSALSESANLSGFYSSIFQDDAELVKKTVKFVWRTLNHVHQVNSKGLVGIGKRIAHVESLLQLEATDVRMIGIWGMGGIVAAGLERLKDKALISISQENTVSMHDIIQETARQIAGQESIEDPRSQRRLFDPDGVYEVLTYNKGNEAIRSIVINLLRMKQLHLKPQVFTKMRKLHFLNLYTAGTRDILLCEPWGLYLPQGLESLPNELRYLGWTNYPLESLPSKFSAENLVELHLPYSRVKKLWQEVPDLVNLKVLILHSSSNLKELLDFSKAPNLEVIDLRFCVGLTSVHPSVFSLKNLEKLDLDGCTSLTSLRSNIHLDSLRYLSLYSCMELKDFSVTSKNMIRLNLERTSIRQIPSSIGSQSKLEKLNLASTYIESLPASIKNLKGLRHLDLRYCEKLRSLPKLPPSVETLDVRECVSLESVTFPPISEQWKENKKKVVFWNCFKLDEHSLTAIETNAKINMVKFAHQHVSTSGDAQGIYVYPGSQVPEWLMHKATHDDYITIAPHSSHVGYIFCFILPEVPYGERVLKLKISTEGGGEDEGEGEGEDEDEDDSMIVYLDRPHHGIKSDHVYLMYNQACSRFLQSRAKHQARLKIKVTLASLALSSEYIQVQLRGFGVSTISNFLQKQELGDAGIPKELYEVYPVAAWNR
ncbi:hypothetical protein VNO80_00379 [Phaseolus coccineus]|uniref:TIR domain-containing protein n=1 Tax=Phaseolus coccineus TaxID=3886 RepID=A0AAN9RQE4_PHACN